MKKRSSRSILALVLALALAVGITGCGKPEEVPIEEEPEPVVVDFMNPLALPPSALFNADLPNLQPVIQEYDTLNSDTVGWLQAAETTIDDVVVQNPNDTNNANAFYLRRDFNGQYLFDGTYFVDYRANMQGGREGLSRNTVIYGHSYTDDPEGVLLNQLKKYRADPEYAEANPYIFFSIEGEDLLWEVFAVFDTQVDFVYNLPTPTDAEFADIIREAQQRSYYTYNTEVTGEDKILTISTCTYNYTTQYPNSYRYVVMGRLVQPGERVKSKASFAPNADRKMP